LSLVTAGAAAAYLVAVAAAAALAGPLELRAAAAAKESWCVLCARWVEPGEPACGIR
jgi:hypothetical protein